MKKLTAVDGSSLVYDSDDTSSKPTPRSLRRTKSASRLMAGKPMQTSEEDEHRGWFWLTGIPAVQAMLHSTFSIPGGKFFVTTDNTYMRMPTADVKHRTETMQLKKNCRGAPAIWQAIRAGKLDTLKELLQASPDPEGLLTIQGELGETAIHHCFQYDKPELAEYLISCHPEVVRHEYAAGEYEGLTCLHFAAMNGDLNMVKLLLQTEKRLDGDLDTLTAVACGNGFGPNSYTYYGGLPLFFAACNNHKDVVDEFLSAGANLLALDFAGSTIFHLLVIHNRKEMYDHLRLYYMDHCFPAVPEGIPKDTEPESWKNSDHLSPITLAASMGRVEMFSFLLDKRTIVEHKYGPMSLQLQPIDELDQCDSKTAIELLTENERMELLQDKWVMSVLRNKWETYARKSFVNRLLFTFFYLAVFNYGALIEESEPGYIQPLAECIAEIFVLIVVVCKLFMEIKEMWRVSISHYFSVGGSMLLENSVSLVHCASVVLVWVVRALSYCGACPPAYQYVLLGIAALSVWMYLLFFLLGWHLTGPLVIMVFRMLKSDLLSFGLVCAVFMGGFSNVFHAVGGRTLGWLDYMQACFLTLVGSSELYDYLPTHFPMFAGILLVVYNVLVTVLLLNLLIAMMNNTFDEVKEDAQNQWLLEWARIIGSFDSETADEDQHKYWINVNGRKYIAMVTINPDVSAHEEGTKEKDEATSTGTRRASLESVFGDTITSIKELSQHKQQLLAQQQGTCVKVLTQEVERLTAQLSAAESRNAQASATAEKESQQLKIERAKLIDHAKKLEREHEALVDRLQAWEQRDTPAVEIEHDADSSSVRSGHSHTSSISKRMSNGTTPSSSNHILSTHHLLNRNSSRYNSSDSMSSTNSTPQRLSIAALSGPPVTISTQIGKSATLTRHASSTSSTLSSFYTSPKYISYTTTPTPHRSASTPTLTSGRQTPRPNSSPMSDLTTTMRSINSPSFLPSGSPGTPVSESIPWVSDTMSDVVSLTNTPNDELLNINHHT